MTPEQQTVEDIKAEIAKLPEIWRSEVEVYASKLRQIVATSQTAGMAFALVGAELAAAAED